MTTNQVRKLHNDDEVYWNDPDDGICSYQIEITDIWFEGEIVCIIDQDGNYLECLVEELS